jgi:hypothetical protein
MRKTIAALATLFFFGCQTVQVRAGPPLLAVPPPPPPRVALAEPQLDLWLEGNGQVGQPEIDLALARSRAALGSALEGRTFARPDEADQVLVVRGQAVALTDGRKQAQAAVIVGCIVVVAALVILAARSDSGRGARAVPGPGGARPRPPGPPMRQVGRPYYGPPAPWFGWGFGWGIHVEAPLASPYPYEPARTPTLEARLPARDFMDGEEVELVVELHDVHTGAVTWWRTASQRIDPRDAGAVRALVDRLIGDQPWAMAPISAK